MNDPVLARLFLAELERHRPGLDDDAPAATQRKAVHTLKGSAGLAGAHGLADALVRVERRLHEGDPAALGAARAAVDAALDALRAGQPIPAARWPEPPADLVARPIAPALAAQYDAEMRDRLARLDTALAAGEDLDAAAAAYREVHAMKGAALGVADDVMAWFCHGIEERLRGASTSAGEARRALDELARWRGLLSELCAAPEHALEALRVMAAARRGDARPHDAAAGDVTALPLPPRRAPRARGSSEMDAVRPRPDPAEAEARAGAAESTVRVPSATLDRLFERVHTLGDAQSHVAEGAAEAHGAAARARQLRARLAEALRLIGPPRPWGAPAAAIARIEDAAREVAALAERLERGASGLKETADHVKRGAAAARADLAAMRVTSAGWLLERVAAAVSAQARRDGREVRLTVTGGETPIDRRLAEALVDPVLQLARNAVAHGIEPATERALRGKPRVGTVQLGAEPRGGGLRITVEDDGAGVDIPDLRARAVATGTISPEMARAADDMTLLGLLFVPGFTTRDSPDLLAGRGVGLDLALAGVRRVGGTIRLASQRGVGLTATLDLPLEGGLVRVVWLEAGGACYALPVQHVRRVLLARDDRSRRAIPLPACVAGVRAAMEGLGRDPASGPTQEGGSSFALAVEIDPIASGQPPPIVGVDRVGAVEEATLRGISQLVATAGPYAGAIVRGDELRLCLDAHALAEIVTLAHGR